MSCILGRILWNLLHYPLHGQIQGHSGLALTGNNRKPTVTENLLLDTVLTTLRKIGQSSQQPYEERVISPLL